MKIDIKKAKKIYKLSKTHNLYLYKKGNKVYYKAIPKRDVKLVREKIGFAWIGLAILAGVMSFFSLTKTPHHEAHAEQSETTEIIETIEPEETNESVREITAEIEEKPEYTGVCAEYYDIVSQFDWDINAVLAIMKAESGCRFDAIGYNKRADGTVWSRDLGLMQINDYYHDTTGWDNPEVNIAKAYEIYKRAGGSFTPWSTYNNQRHLEYLSE